jgi:hypothetical protein
MVHHPPDELKSVGLADVGALEPGGRLLVIHVRRPRNWLSQFTIRVGCTSMFGRGFEHLAPILGAATGLRRRAQLRNLLRVSVPSWRPSRNRAVTTPYAAGFPGNRRDTGALHNDPRATSISTDHVGAAGGGLLPGPGVPERPIWLFHVAP